MKPLPILLLLLLYATMAHSQNFVNQKATYIYDYFAEKYGKDAISVERAGNGIRYIQVSVGVDGITKGYGIRDSNHTCFVYIAVYPNSYLQSITELLDDNYEKENHFQWIESGDGVKARWMLTKQKEYFTLTVQEL